ncbi:dihydroxyacetone kinase subunit DhaL [Alkalicoccus chagannorensis]|uniref:dihydroxyacetone kinase subunit DhaL n=1 Tax=Alkalicoccus chagannorensis TaxID=427072 RepID=UPI00041F787D|nr:dihydroxyacetone kinase subunit DhaL [Alkalicoccus chagannorensis]
MNQQDAVNWILSFQKKIESSKEYLTDLDQAVGDGDHGINMNRGLQHAAGVLHEKTFETPGDVLKAVSTAFISKVGGASGPLYGSAMLKASGSCGGKETLEDEDVKAMLRAAADAVQARGRAERGEKTMYDVWEAVVRAAEEKEDIDWQHVRMKTAEAADATKEMQAKKGRAAYLGARSIGHLDPGSVSTRMLIESLAEVLESGDS